MRRFIYLIYNNRRLYPPAVARSRSIKADMLAGQGDSLHGVSRVGDCCGGAVDSKDLVGWFQPDLGAQVLKHPVADRNSCALGIGVCCNVGKLLMDLLCHRINLYYFGQYNHFIINCQAIVKLFMLPFLE